MVSSMVTMQSNIAMEWHWTAATNSVQVRTRSCFWSSLSSFGNHLAVFLTRPRSSRRMLCIVPFETPWAKARSLQLTHLSSTLAATAATMSAVLLVFLALRCLWSSVVFPAFTFLMI
jgi:hypothetical protein